MGWSRLLDPGPSLPQNLFVERSFVLSGHRTAGHGRRRQRAAPGTGRRRTGLVRPYGQDDPAAAQGLQPFPVRTRRAIRRRKIDHQPDRAQRDQPDAGDDLAPVPGARRLDRAGPGLERRGALHREILPRRYAEPLVGRRQGAPCHHRLDQDHRMAAMVRRAGRAGRRARFRSAPARLGGMPLRARRRVRGRGRRRRAAREGRRNPALSLRPPPYGPLRRRPGPGAPRWSASSKPR